MEMELYTKRAHPRVYHEAPIEYANFNAEDYCGAKMHNTSVDGMYFESDSALQPESDICIRMGNDVPDRPEDYRFYRAKVKWCKAITNVDATCYGVGVHYVVKSHMTYGPTYSCDLCGENIPYGKIHITDDFVYLCSGCFKHMEDIPDRKLKESIMDFIIGNVI